jgi:guanylate kinase
MREKKGLIFVISGPSGSGKTTLIKSLLKDKGLKEVLAKSVSFTTRPKRRNEKDKRDYFFIRREQFDKLLNRKKIIEWTKYLDYYYGTPKDYLDEQLDKGRHIALCLDTKGAAKIKGIYPGNTVTIFILPPEIEALRQRMHLRSRKTREKKLSLRLKLASKEISQAGSYDYRIINDEFSTALSELKEIIAARTEHKE